ncbi:hydrolase 2, exosortase A system-associated [Comamonadaceae bacterium G21597-S1]|nr:hydrolase 2, exosortase A system-associated [Comamonadaceae bacterium G21597-S1]
MSGQGTSQDCAVRGLFLDAPSGRIFAAHHGPAQSASAHGQVLLVPPFNEEMNRCRSMMTLQALELAKLGYGVLVVDPHGTGDSEGEFGDARWELWLQDLEAAFHWLDKQPGECRAIMGIRLGAILVTEVLHRLQATGIAVILWQPVTDGKIHLTQFLRVRMAALLDRADLPKETTASMRQQLGQGVSVEVAGYEIHPELALAIDGARLARHAPVLATRTLWMEVAAAAGATLAPASQAVVSTWQDEGMQVDARTVEGPAFWQLHERVTAPAVIETTTAWFQNQLASP